MWNCVVLVLCVCVLITVPTLQGSEFTDLENLRVNESISHRRPPTFPRERWRPVQLPRTPRLSKKDQISMRMRLLELKSKNKCPGKKTCASKCCPIGMGFVVSEQRCRNISHDFLPPVMESYTVIKGFNASKEFHILEGLLECFPKKKEIVRLVSKVQRIFYLQTNGTLYIESDRAVGPGMLLNINKYCIDWFITDDNKTEWDAIICHISRPFKMHRTLTIACILISCVLVLLRLVAFACLPELQTLHGKIVLAYLINFFLVLVLVVSKMLLTNGNYINREACAILSFIVYFVILSAFFWRNVMCYDIWWTFSGKRAKSGQGSSSRRRFCLYCAYTVGFPTVLTVLMTALEFSDLPIEHALMPKVRHYGCKDMDGNTKLIYYNGPIFPMFVINMVLFALTALKIAAIKKETRTVLKSKESGTHDRNNDVERFTLYANLFASMLFVEVNWILESVTIFYPDAQNIVLISDICNVAILLFIFVHFLCKKRIWILIKKRFQHMRGLSSGLTNFTLTNRTITSQTSQIPHIQDYTIAAVLWNPIESQNDTESPDFIRKKSNLPESQEDNLTNKHSRDSQNPTESQDDTQSPNEKSSPTENQGDSQSPDFSREKSSHAESQKYTQSPEFTRKNSSPAESQDGHQSIDFIRDNSRPAVSQVHTQSPDFSREKSSPAESQVDTQLPDLKREKSSSGALPRVRMTPNHPILAERNRTLLRVRRTLSYPTSSERSRASPRARITLNRPTSAERTQAVLRARRTLSYPTSYERSRAPPRARMTLSHSTLAERTQAVLRARKTLRYSTSYERNQTLLRVRKTLNHPKSQ